MTPKTVLLVDAHSDSRLVYATMLEHSGFRVLEATSDEEGLRLARVGGPDVILTELFPWTAEGRLLPERLREVPETASIPVIAVTAHVVSAEWEEVLTRSCTRVLTKPCGPRRILDEVRRVV